MSRERTFQGLSMYDDCFEIFHTDDYMDLFFSVEVFKILDVDGYSSFQRLLKDLWACGKQRNLAKL